MNSYSTRLPFRVLKDLDAEIENASDALEQQVLFAKRACALARFSAIPEASDQIKLLRNHNQNYNPRLTAWIIFCEALVNHFENLDPVHSLDRLKRCYAISVAIGELELISASQAWSATCQFMMGNSRAASEHLEKLFGTDRLIEQHTLARGHLVLADLLSWSGQPNLARRWYQEARREAVSYGDIAFQSTILFNSASFHVLELTLRSCTGIPVGDEDVRIAMLEVQSAASLDSGIGQPYLRHLIPILIAEAELLNEKFERATVQFNAVIANLESVTPQRLRPKILAERAWLLAKRSQIGPSMSDSKLAATMVEHCTDIDDLVIYHARLSEALRICGDHLQATEHEISMARCKLELDHVRAEMQESLRQVLDLAERKQEKTRQ